MLTGEGLAKYAKDKIGTPYFFGAKMQTLTESLMATMHRMYPKTVDKEYIAIARSKGIVGKVCTDCSGLIGGYRKKQIGSYQLYQSAKQKIPIAAAESFPIGTVLWKSGHVGVYIGKEDGIPMVVEAKGIRYGVIKTRLKDTNWVYGLLYADMSYSEVLHQDFKKRNPFTEPKRIIKKYRKGEDVKWVQFELREAGFNIPFYYKGNLYNEVKIDGVAGKITDAAIRAFQQSCKITINGKSGVDGKVGPITIDLLKQK